MHARYNDPRIFADSTFAKTHIAARENHGETEIKAIKIAKRENVRDFRDSVIIQEPIIGAPYQVVTFSIVITFSRPSRKTRRYADTGLRVAAHYKRRRRRPILQNYGPISPAGYTSRRSRGNEN